ncbi:Blue-sensitive opsin [Dirofilaria immitis]
MIVVAGVGVSAVTDASTRYSNRIITARQQLLIIGDLLCGDPLQHVHLWVAARRAYSAALNGEGWANLRRAGERSEGSPERRFYCSIRLVLKRGPRVHLSKQQGVITRERKTPEACDHFPIFMRHKEL